MTSISRHLEGDSWWLARCRVPQPGSGNLVPSLLTFECDPWSTSFPSDRLWQLQQPYTDGRKGRFGGQLQRLPQCGLNRPRGRSLSAASCCNDASILIEVAVVSSRADDDVAVKYGDVFNAKTPGLLLDVIPLATSALSSSECSGQQ